MNDIEEIKRLQKLRSTGRKSRIVKKGGIYPPPLPNSSEEREHFYYNPLYAPNVSAFTQYESMHYEETVELVKEIHRMKEEFAYYKIQMEKMERKMKERRILEKFELLKVLIPLLDNQKHKSILHTSSGDELLDCVESLLKLLGGRSDPIRILLEDVLERTMRQHLTQLFQYSNAINFDVHITKHLPFMYADKNVTLRVDLQFDRELIDFIYMAKCKISSEKSVDNMYQRLAVLVDQKMGGTTVNRAICYDHCMELVSRNYNSVVLIGDIQKGDNLPRALMYKAVCDALLLDDPDTYPLKCRIVNISQGSQKFLWCVVEGLDGRRKIVDLTVYPGKYHAENLFPDIKWAAITGDNRTKIPAWLNVDELRKKSPIIGQGASGKIWKVQNPDTRENLAMKIVPVSSFQQDDSDEDSAVKEFRFMSYYQHPNITQLKGGGIDASNPSQVIILMELMTTSADVYFHAPERKDLMFNIETAVFLLQAARGVLYIHSRNSIHRDIKPANILIQLDRFDTIKKVQISDFGISRMLHKQELAKSFVGTLLYLAPEVRNFKPYNHKVDSYSFGVTMGEIICAERPNPLLPFSRLQLKQKSAPETLIDLYERCVDNDPERRPYFDEIVYILEIVILDLVIAELREKMRAEFEAIDDEDTTEQSQERSEMLGAILEKYGAASVLI